MNKLKNRVVFTSVKNESMLLPVWLSYYSRYFKDIVIVDHGSDDGSIKKAKKYFTFQHIIDNRFQETNPTGRSINSEIDKEHMIQYQKRLLEKYTWVLYVHADEFVVADPKKYQDLGDFIDRLDKDYVFCNGRAILHFPEREADMDFSKPILPQRTYWWYENYSSHKPLLSRVPLRWKTGYHSIEEISDGEKKNEVNPIYEKDLYLIHLQYCDLKLFNSRSRNAFNMDWFNKGKQDSSLERIPERIKNIF